MKLKLYMETTVPSYLTARPSRDLVVAGHQQITREWWQERRESFQIFVSQLVVDEVSAGDPAAVRERLQAIEDLPLLDITPEVEPLASALLKVKAHVLPRKAATDAAHIALSAVHWMDLLVTWNCVPIANTVMAKAVAKVCEDHGFECPVICTPEELLGE
jgi:predicted nucleic acid-binding protein